MDKPSNDDAAIEHFQAELTRCEETSIRLAAELPAIIAAIPTEPEIWDLVNQTAKTFRAVWAAKSGEVCAFWDRLCALLRNERTRRAIAETIETAELERMAKL